MSGKENQNALSKVYAASELLTDAWFPATPELLKKVQEVLAAESDRAAIVNACEQDPALYLHAIKKLSALSAHGEAWGTHTPNTLIHNANLNDLKKIFSSPGSVSQHRFSMITALQARRSQKSLLSAITAQSLGPAFDVDPQLSYSCALLRQLGLTLIAWNYPHVYARQLSAARTGIELDQSFSRILGYTPSLLGITIVQRWGLRPDVRLSIGDTGLRPHEVDEHRQSAQTLVKLCEIGETLAQIAEPEHFSEGNADWVRARTEVEHALGPAGFAKLKERLVEANTKFLKNLPENVRVTASTVEEHLETKPSAAGSGAFSRNRYIKNCPTRVQEQLRDFYGRIGDGAVTKENVEMLIKYVIPGAGFFRGCVYLIDPDTFGLRPRMAVGQAKLSEFKTITNTAIPYSLDPAALAYRTNAVVFERDSRVDDRNVAYAAISLGSIQRIGVLYLEPSNELLRSEFTDPLGCFKAIAQTLMDCLQLS